MHTQIQIDKNAYNANTHVHMFTQKQLQNLTNKCTYKYKKHMFLRIQRKLSFRSKCCHMKIVDRNTFRYKYKYCACRCFIVDVSCIASC